MDDAPIPAQLAEGHPDVAAVAPHVDEVLEDVARAALDGGGNPFTFGRELADSAGPDRWRVESTAAAEWAMRKWVEARRRIDAAEEQAREWHAQVDTWLAKTTARDEATCGFMGAHLERYALEQAEAGGPAQLRLPSGTVPTRKENPKPVIRDEELFISWARVQMPEAAPATYRALVSELRKRVTLVDQPTGRVELLLACEHVLVTPEEQQVRPGERVLCTVCGEPVDVQDVQPELRRVAVWANEDGEAVPVPGVEVTPGGRVALSISPV